jgi:2'-5' RNA ligase
MPSSVSRNLFLALPLPAGVRAEARWVRDAVGRCARPVRNDLFHISILGLGRFSTPPDPLVARIHRAFDGVDLSACRAVFDQLVRNAKVAVLLPSEPLPAVRALHDRLTAALRHARLAPPPGRGCRPHIAVGYDPDAQGVEWIDPLSWKATELVLIESLIGCRRHVIRGRWPLVGNAGQARDRQ